MPIARDMLDQMRHLLRPIATRVVNSIARGVVQLVDDSVKMQLLQLGVLSGETIDGAERFQPYGLSSVPLPGAEVTWDRLRLRAEGGTDHRGRVRVGTVLVTPTVPEGES